MFFGVCERCGIVYNVLLKITKITAGVIGVAIAIAICILIIASARYMIKKGNEIEKNKDDNPR